MPAPAPTSTPSEKPRIMFVDDEIRILEGLAVHLRRDYDVHLASSGDQALKILKEVNGVAVVVSDMRMPQMNGAALLHQIRTTYPDTVRILLTGEPGRDAAISAVNDGQVFRFLTKPCPPDRLKATISSAVGQHRLQLAERNLLQETLIGCIKALVDVLAITNPVAFGRGNRVKRLATDFSKALGYRGFWQLEAAAMLSQIGYISLPVELVEKLYYGESLTKEESVLAGAAPEVAGKLLGHIPRLEPVLQILATVNNPKPRTTDENEGTVAIGAHILAMTTDYDALIAQGKSSEAAVKVMSGRADRYGTQMLERFANFVGTHAATFEIMEVMLRNVQPGMVFLDDLKTPMGKLLVPRDFEVTSTFLQRLENFNNDLLTTKVRVRSSAPATPPAQARAAS